MKQLDPKAVWFFFFNSILMWSLVIILLTPMALGILVRESSTGGEFPLEFRAWVWFIPVGFFVFAFLWSKLTYHFYRYELLDLGFRKESGIIHKKYVTIPYDRIQNVDINRGILARILGLSDLNIQTAGASAVRSVGASAEGRLPAVSAAVAEELRDELIRRSHQSRNQGL